MYFSFKLAFGRGRIEDGGNEYLVEQRLNVPEELDPVQYDSTYVEKDNWDVSWGADSYDWNLDDAPEKLIEHTEVTSGNYARQAVKSGRPSWVIRGK